MAIEHRETYPERFRDQGSATGLERVGDAERSATCDALSEHFANGRLSPAEFEQRLDLAVHAVTDEDLRVLTVDLPAAARGPAPQRPVSTSWPVVSVLALIGLIGSLVVAGGMLLVLGVVSPVLFAAACVGGTAAAVGGASAGYLLKQHLQVRRPGE